MESFTYVVLMFSRLGIKAAVPQILFMNNVGFAFYLCFIRYFEQLEASQLIIYVCIVEVINIFNVITLEN